MHSHEIGRAGEDIAANYLLGNDFHILHRNMRQGRLEIDIVAQRGTTLYFVEVKSRSCSPQSVDDFMPEAGMTAAKIERTLQAAQWYLIDNKHAGEISIDLIAVNIARNGSYNLRHYPAVQWK